MMIFLIPPFLKAALAMLKSGIVLLGVLFKFKLFWRKNVKDPA